MMRVLLAVACLVAGALAAPTTTSADDPFLMLIKEIESASFFRTLSDAYRLLTFEMLTAAETYNLNTLLDNLGHKELLKYIDALPKDYEHKFITYAIVHLENELSSNSSS